jgi:hypothetical protein
MHYFTLLRGVLHLWLSFLPVEYTSKMMNMKVVVVVVVVMTMMRRMMTIYLQI